MIKHFIGVWLAYWLAIALLPTKSIYPGTVQAFLLQFSFVALVLLGFFAIAPSAPRTSVEIRSAKHLIWLALGMSLVGLLALTYDKVAIQGIDYSRGLAAAREQWRQFGEEREGAASSIYSALGYLVGSAYYVAAVLAVTQSRSLTARHRLFVLFLCISFLLANSLITGGRSNVLLFAAFVLGAFASRTVHLSELFPKTAQRFLVSLVLALVFTYTVFIFYQRAATSELAAAEYVLGFLPYIGLEAATWYSDLLDGSTVSSLSAMLVLSTSYITHSFATVAAIIDSPGEDKVILFLNSAKILSKLGLVSQPDGDWFLAGRLPSLPGALWHQFGAPLFVAWSISIGALAALAQHWAARRPNRLLPLGTHAMAYVTLLLSPALFAGDFLSFPYVAGAFVQLAFIAACLRIRVSARPAQTSITKSIGDYESATAPRLRDSR